MASNTNAQPGSLDATSEENSSKSGNSQVDVKQVLNTETTGQPPENVNSTPDDPQAESNANAQPGSLDATSEENSSKSGDPEVDAQQVLNTESTGKSPKNANS